MTEKKPIVTYKKKRTCPEIRAAKVAKLKEKYAKWMAESEQKHLIKEMTLWAIESELRQRYTVNQIYRLAAEHESRLIGSLEKDWELERRLEDLEKEIIDTESSTFKVLGDGSIELADEHLNYAAGIFGEVTRLAALSARKGKIIHSKWKAQQGAQAMLANDPRQQEKQLIKDCWLDWQAGKTQYKSKAAFARDMLTKVENLTSNKKIEDWCREWEKETTTQPVG